ncbi:MAG: TAXI family TRAP transporter solute-binding subunit [Chromatiales bacterium]|nr:TAXI family TRAP transporter solute-binding subunit [Chromatiales bacterium]
MIERSSVPSILGVVCATALVVLTGAQVATAQDNLNIVRIGTGGVGGTYFPIGSIIAQAVSAPAEGITPDEGTAVPGLLAVAHISSGSLANVRAMRAGALDGALAQADVAYWAYRGTGPFAKEQPAKNLRTIANLYRESLHLVARLGSGIKSVSDLRGRRVSLDEPGSGTLHDAELVLRHYDLRDGECVPRGNAPSVRVRLAPRGERRARNGVSRDTGWRTMDALGFVRIPLGFADHGATGSVKNAGNADLAEIAVVSDIRKG